MSMLESNSEIAQYGQVNKMLWEALACSLCITVTLKNGNQLSGHFNGAQIINNSTIGGRMKYSGILTIQDGSSKRLGIDLLDIMAIEPAANS